MILKDKNTIEYLWDKLPEKYHFDENDTFLLRRVLHIGLALMNKIVVLGLTEEFYNEFKEDCDKMVGIL